MDRVVGQAVTSPQIPVHAGGGDLRGKLSDLGVRLHHAALRGDPAGAPARYVPQQVLQDLCLAFLVEPGPRCGRGATNGRSGEMQEGSTRDWRVWIPFRVPLIPLYPVSLFFCLSLSLSATVSAAVVPSTPIFSPTMGGGSNSSLSLDSGGTEPMPGGYLTPDL